MGVGSTAGIRAVLSGPRVEQLDRRTCGRHRRHAALDRACSLVFHGADAFAPHQRSGRYGKSAELCRHRARDHLCARPLQAQCRALPQRHREHQRRGLGARCRHPASALCQPPCPSAAWLQPRRDHGHADRSGADPGTCRAASRFSGGQGRTPQRHHRGSRANMQGRLVGVDRDRHEPGDQPENRQGGNPWCQPRHHRAQAGRRAPPPHGPARCAYRPAQSDPVRRASGRLAGGSAPRPDDRRPDVHRSGPVQGSQ